MANLGRVSSAAAGEIKRLVATVLGVRVERELRPRPERAHKRCAHGGARRRRSRRRDGEGGLRREQHGERGAVLAQHVVEQPRVHDTAGVVRGRAQARLGKVGERGAVARELNKWQQARRRRQSRAERAQVEVDGERGADRLARER